MEVLKYLCLQPSVYLRYEDMFEGFARLEIGVKKAIQEERRRGPRLISLGYIQKLAVFAL